MEILIVPIVVSLFTMGLYIVSGQGKILHPLRVWVMGWKVHYAIKKPLITCLYCMPSFWGSIIYWSWAVNSKIVWANYAVDWAFCLLAGVALNAILYNIYRAHESVASYNSVREIVHRHTYAPQIAFQEKKEESF